jgi:hypothetical protein
MEITIINTFFATSTRFIDFSDNTLSVSSNSSSSTTWALLFILAVLPHDNFYSILFTFLEVSPQIVLEKGEDQDFLAYALDIITQVR